MENKLNDFDFLKENSSFGIQERFIYFDGSSVVPMQFAAILNASSDSSSFDKEIFQKFAAERMLSFLPAHFIYSQNLVSPEVIFGNSDITQVLSNLTLSPRLKADALSSCLESPFHEPDYNNFLLKINDNLNINILNEVPCFNKEYKDFFSERHLNFSAKECITADNLVMPIVSGTYLKIQNSVREDIYGKES